MARKVVPGHNPLIGWAVIAVLTLAGLVAIRFAWPGPSSDQPHYHADFAIYINGQPLDFDDPRYYEEVTACSDSYRDSPASRAHLHAPDPGVVHVHDYAVTWSHFLANLGLVLADDYLATPTNAYLPGDNNQLRFILNGQPVSYPSSKVIGNEDILLIDYGSDPDDILRERYQRIEPGAPGANQTYDPAGCFGADETSSTAGRLWRALQIWR